MGRVDGPPFQLVRRTVGHSGCRRVPTPGRDLQQLVRLGRHLGYGPNPQLVARIKAADLLLVIGPRLVEPTTDGYTLITPDHPGQTLIHVHPDPEELDRVYRADVPICSNVGVFAEMLASTRPPERPHPS